MDIALSAQQVQAQSDFRTFIDQEITPYVAQHDAEERTPPEMISKLATAGYLGAAVPQEWGGEMRDALTFGLLCEEIGRSSASLLSLLTVHTMVCQAILKWGSAAQREQWLPKLAKGEIIGAFGLTESEVGSDAKSVETNAVLNDDTYVLNGSKKWISFAQVADVFLIFAQSEGKPTAFLVERTCPGFTTTPLNGLLGFKSAMLAEIRLQDCVIPADNMLGRVGFGFSHVAGTALDHGRYCIAWGCLGLGEACLHASLKYSNERKQFGALLKNHQLIQHMIAEMVTDLKATRMLCYHAAYLKQQGDPALIMETSIAKYFASKVVNQAAHNAVQIHGANGCSRDYPVERYLRDAKIMEIIEGSSQMQQIIIAKSAYQQFALAKRQAKVTV